MPVDRPERTRRQYIMAVGSIALGILAGCSGDGGSDGNGGGEGSDGGSGGADSGDTGQLEFVGVEWATEGACRSPAK